MEKTFTEKQRRNIRLGAFSILIEWILFLAGISSVICLVAYGNYFGSRNVHIPRFATYLFLSGVILLILCGVAYVIVAFRIKCPSCDYQLLKNPKGFGPRNYHYHPSGSKARGFNAWSYQIARVIQKKKIQCIKCGRDYDLD